MKSMPRPADGDVHAFAVDIAADRDARNAVERFREVCVRELADVLRENRVREIDGVALVIRRLFEASAIARHNDGLDRGVV